LGISKTVSGYLDGFSCEDADEWHSIYGPPFDHGSSFWDCADTVIAGCIDTAEKHEGAASTRFLFHSTYNGEDSSSCFLRTERQLNFGPVGGGASVRMWNKHWVEGGHADLVNAIYINTDPSPSAEEELFYSTSGAEAWTLKKHTLVVGGMRYLGWSVTLHNVGAFSFKNWVDHVVISSSQYVTVTGLTPGQKVELYRSSDDTKLDTQTCAAPPASSVVFDVDAEDFPEQMYLKIYATNGSTLIETSASYNMCGGDTWEWTADAGTLKITSDAFIIYRGAATGTPKTAAITANLMTVGGADYPGALIYFQAANGAVSPSSDTTDTGGDAHTALTSLMTPHGIAVVKAQWLGDSNVPACSTYVMVHVFYDLEVPDSAIGFQLYIEGYPVEFVSGKYGINAQSKPETVDVEIPEWDANLIPFGLMNVYRKGVQEFAGIYLTPDRHLSDAPRVTLRGVDLTFLLVDRVVDLKIYSGKTPAYIVNDLLTFFDSGISPGSLEPSADALTITITSENLLAGIQRVCNGVCWGLRVNLDRTLDIAETFGGSPSGAAFTEGVDIFDVDVTSDYSKIANWVRMVGDGIVSTKQDGTNILAQGLHQLPSFQTSISSQSTLDIACQALLDLVKDRSETETLLANDTYDPGTFKSEDTITVTAPSVDMAGEYQIKRIERDMTDANFVLLELSNRSAQYWELDEAYRRMIKDLSV